MCFGSYLSPLLAKPDKPELHYDYTFQCGVSEGMEAIKKKLANLKSEKEAADEKADEAEAQKKEAEARADAVRNWAV